jgi:hypothetical protein
MALRSAYQYSIIPLDYSDNYVLPHACTYHMLSIPIIVVSDSQIYNDP